MTKFQFPVTANYYYPSIKIGKYTRVEDNEEKNDNILKEIVVFVVLLSFSLFSLVSVVKVVF